jgi:tRNA A37 N6-isopentenylltransferase MiaA
MSKNFGIIEALESLAPNTFWALNGDDYSGLEWLDKEQTKPTEKQLATEAKRLQAQYDALEYQRLRAVEYPSIIDYIDGVVKGDQKQIDAYINACLAVKERYPKTNG